MYIVQYKHSISNRMLRAKQELKFYPQCHSVIKQFFDLQIIAVGMNPHNWYSFFGNYSKICRAFATMIVLVMVVNLEHRIGRLLMYLLKHLMPLCFVQWFGLQPLSLIAMEDIPAAAAAAAATANADKKILFFFFISVLMWPCQQAPLTLPQVQYGTKKKKYFFFFSAKKRKKYFSLQEMPPVNVTIKFFLPGHTCTNSIAISIQ